MSPSTRYGARAVHQLHVALQLLTSFDSTSDQLAHNRVHGEDGGAGGQFSSWRSLWGWRASVTRWTAPKKLASGKM